MTVANHHKMELCRRNTRERGAISWQFSLTLLVIALSVNAGIHYVPLAYNSKAYEDVMQQTVNQAVLMPGSNGKEQVEAAKKQLRRLADEYSLPDDLTINVRQAENQHDMEATVEFSEPIELLPFSLYQYDYEFRRTVKSKSLLN